MEDSIKAAIDDFRVSHAIENKNILAREVRKLSTISDKYEALERAVKKYFLFSGDAANMGVALSALQEAKKSIHNEESK